MYIVLFIIIVIVYKYCYYPAAPARRSATAPMSAQYNTI